MFVVRILFCLLVGRLIRNDIGLLGNGPREGHNLKLKKNLTKRNVVALSV